MKKKKGGLYGVSLGVGHIMNVTVLALRVLNTVNNIFVPTSTKNKKSQAISRMEKMPVHLKDKNIVELYMPMAKEGLEEYWYNAVEEVKKVLLKGQDAAFAGIGDLLHYGTFYYVESKLKKEGFETAYVPGITSYQSLAQNIGLPLVQGDETLAVYPSDDIPIDDIKKYDAVVFLKKPDNIELYKELSKDYLLYLGINLGMNGEKFGKVDNIEEDLKGVPYFSLIIARRRRKNL